MRGSGGAVQHELKILNLGCGYRTSPRCVNIDFSIGLRVKDSFVGRTGLAKLVFNGERWKSFDSITGDILVHNLKKGIPAEDSSIDAVYHSHVLEHLDRVDSDVVPAFLAEVLRVLKPGGVHRIVVPDMERLCRDYLSHLEECVSTNRFTDEHDVIIGQLITQMVRKEAYGTSRQPRLRRKIENLVLGDARKRAETHQWMYDRVNLTCILDKAQFRDIRQVDHLTSSIPQWDTIALDRGPDGGEYKPGSLYVEAIK